MEEKEQKKKRQKTLKKRKKRALSQSKKRKECGREREVEGNKRKYSCCCCGGGGGAPLPQTLAWCLGGGEDFELVLALPEAWGRELVARSAGASVIGRMEPRQGGQTLRWSDGAPLAEAPALGYQHYG